VLDEKALMAQPMDLGVLGKLNCPGSDPAVWRAMAQHDPVGMQAFGRMLLEAKNSPAYLDSKDKRLDMQNEFFMNTTLQRMHESFKAGDPSFTDHVLGKVRSQYGNDGKVLLGNLSAQFEAKKFGLEATHDLRLPQDEGVCHRAATKWASCALTGSPFKYEGMNIDKIDAKFKAYGDSVTQAAGHARQTGGDVVGAVLQTDEAAVRAWTSKFTDANGVEHRGEIQAGPTLTMTPTEYLRQHPLGEGEGLMVSVKMFSPTKGHSGHTMALVGGREPRFVDTGQETEFKVRNPDIGGALEQYVNQVVKSAPDAQLSFVLVPLKRTGAAQAQGVR
jgi:hypothetical protein